MDQISLHHVPAFGPRSLAKHMFNSLSRAFPMQRRATCSLSPTAPCNQAACGWLAELLMNLVPPSHAREQGPLPSIMSELESVASGRLSATRHPAAERIVAIGDVHGDVDAMRDALRNAGLIDNQDTWTGGKSVLVQVGDQLDRGNRERDIYRLLFQLQDSAPAAGGAVHILLGNHELMNMRLDFRYVTKGGFADFESTSKRDSKRVGKVPNEVAKTIRALPANMRARARALCVGGPLASELAERAHVAVIVGDNVFVHAGLTPRHFTFGGQDGKDAEQTLDYLNVATKQFLRGKGKYPMVLRGGLSPVWMRDYSREGVRNGSTECRMLAETLKMVNAKRMIVGHTPQSMGINSVCGGRVWRIDTGMSAAYGGVPEAIEINRRGGVKIFTPNGVVQGSARFK